jgi:hypothetical protein
MAGGRFPAMNKTTVYLPPDLQRRLQQLSRRTGRPQADLIRDALQAYLDGQPAPSRPGFVGMGEDPELSADRAKAWVRARWSRRPREAR